VASPDVSTTSSAAPDESAQQRTAPPSTTVTRVDAALLAALAAASALLRMSLLDTWYWADEGQSIGIASHRLFDIPGLLRRDGSPPLYYLLLHGWMAVAGRSETATHILSLVFALAVVPVAFWGGRTFFGARAGWCCAVLAACNPFLTYYGQETRMYSLVALLSLLATTCFVHAFALGHRRYVLPFGIALALLLYTHNWGLLVALAFLAATAGCAFWTGDRHRAWTDAFVAFGATALLYLPWLPTLLQQAAHTGAPWSPAPTISQALTDLIHLVGDKWAAAVVVLVGGAGVIKAAAGRAVTPDRRIVLTVALVTALPIVTAVGVSRASPVWTARYLAVAVAPLFLLAGMGLARMGKVGVVGLAVVVLLSPQGVSRVNGSSNTGTAFRSNVKLVMAHLPKLGRGDIVVSVQPDEVPLLSFYGPADARFATPLGLTANPSVFDWRNALDKLRSSRSTAVLQPLVQALAPGRHLVLVVPTAVVMRSDLPWFTLMRERAQTFRRELVSDRRLRLEGVFPGGRHDPIGSSAHALVFRRTNIGRTDHS